MDLFKIYILTFFLLSSLGVFGQEFAKNANKQEEDFEIYIKEGNYVDKNGDLFSGTIPQFSDQGHKIAEYSFINGKRHGEAIFYYQNGVLKELGQYQLNKKHGKWQSWSKDGKLVYSGTYNKGKRHGYWFIYFPNGQKHMKKNYNMGNKVGHWIWWDEKGKVTKNYLF